MIESAADRRRKRVVEHTISGFDDANEAIIFGNTVEKIVKDNIGKQKFCQFIGAPDTLMAITPEWTGPTVLKTTFLELKGNDTAQYICEKMKLAVKVHNESNRKSAKILKEIIREKPQPQFIGG